jgi:hypothetical protein
MGSNENGRGFEYETVRLLIYRGYAASSGTASAQQRDSDKLDSCPDDVASRIRRAAPLVADWIRTRVPVAAGVTVDRMTDSYGGVADIVIRQGQQVLMAVSLKFNHDALKHPRPYSMAVSCGFPRLSVQDREHRAAMVSAVSPLVQAANKQGAELFRELPEQTRDMYELVVKACVHSLRGWTRAEGSRVAANLFRFIVGSGYFKVIAPRDERMPIVVQDFTKVTCPTALVAEADGSYLQLFFNNSWHVRMRLHSASSRINVEGNQIALKFDARREKGDVPTARLDSPPP